MPPGSRGRAAREVWFKEIFSDEFFRTLSENIDTVTEREVDFGPLVQLITTTIAPGTWQVQDGTGTPVDEDAFVTDLGRAIVEAVSDPAEAARRGAAGRARAVESFSWTTIAERTVDVYQAVLEGGAQPS